MMVGVRGWGGGSGCENCVRGRMYICALRASLSVPATQRELLLERRVLRVQQGRQVWGGRSSGCVM